MRYDIYIYMYVCIYTYVYIYIYIYMSLGAEGLIDQVWTRLPEIRYFFPLNVHINLSLKSLPSLKKKIIL